MRWQYRVFKSLIKPQPSNPQTSTTDEYRVFKSLIKPQRIDSVETPLWFELFKNLKLYVNELFQNYNFSIFPETEIFTFIGLCVNQPPIPSPYPVILL